MPAYPQTAGLLDLVGGEAVLAGLVELVLAQHPFVQVGVLVGMMGLFYLKVIGSTLIGILKVVLHRSGEAIKDQEDER
ncbi:hypothetical protein ABZ234_12785 [Nocardiopsis sp. NPDC006198]|uniref:hypothetical protein n=1 Tax=Nocardiopsis sp. NPDC006198 TaxID=3154472 RepID=UPI0033B8EDA8